MQRTESQIETTIIDLLKDMTQDWDLDLDEKISSETLLVEDLSFASVDIIHLIVSIEEHYKQKLGFQELVMRNGRYVDDISVSELVDFVSAKLNGMS
ncbi:MAG: acyl carrier protein [Microcoleus sp. SIO2G3]|nr:acyl carrier protein [Microcoleus sp. SIO2G3]